MKKALMGAALAATMSFGWAGGAEAAPLVIDFTIDGTNLQTFGTAPYGITKADFPASGTATLDVTGAGVTVQDFALTIGGTMFDESQFSEALLIGGSSVALFSPVDPSSSTARYELAFEVQGSQPNLSSEFFIGLPTGQLDCTGCVSAKLISGVPPVPLPSSAPMFGAALLGLAGLGFAAKRKKAAAVA